VCDVWHFPIKDYSKFRLSKKKLDASISWIRKMQLTKTKYLFILGRLLKYMGKRERSYSDTNTLEHFWQHPARVRLLRSSDPVIPLLGLHLANTYMRRHSQGASYNDS
jgi:hypothetical protein